MLTIAFAMISVWVAITPVSTNAQDFQWEFWATNYVTDIGVAKAKQADKNDDLIKTIQKAINWALWLLAAVALILVIYAWFLMLTSGWDSKKYDQWLSIIKNAAIWLVIIGVSWLIVSLVFYVIEWATKNAGS